MLEGNIESELYASGQTFDEYLRSLPEEREAFERNYVAVKPKAEDVEAIRQEVRRLGGLKVAALSEWWCGDCQRWLPVLARLAAEVPEIEVRVFSAEANPELMERYLKEGKYRSLPVFVFLDTALREVGCWFERPAAADATLRELREHMGRDFLEQETMRELRELLHQAKRQ